MFSVVICSRSSVLSDELKQNIAETIGCEYELVVIENASGNYSIFQAYNEGVRRAKGDIVCFMHDDVLFRTRHWGVIIENHFQENRQMGLLGFAGTHFLPDTPMYWYSSPFVSQRNLNNDQGVVEEHFHEEWFGERQMVEVVAVDGFCFFVRKSLFDQIVFDEKNYKGFHLYDMDICMQVLKAGYKVCVCRDVLAEHAWSESEQLSKSGGELFFTNLELFASKWQSELPIHRGLDLPEEIFDKVNGLFRQFYESKQMRKSRAYRLGKCLLSPFSWLRR